MIKYSTELLFHLLCYECHNWWSYASTENYKPKTMFCPHCGHESRLEPIENNE
tara:strand:+ start:1246 stop:1404 length:159 start_codon:yes stop_codon:yes gene_type:complete